MRQYHKSPKAFRVIDTVQFLGQSSLAILRDEVALIGNSVLNIVPSLPIRKRVHLYIPRSRNVIIRGDSRRDTRCRSWNPPQTRARRIRFAAPLH